MASALNLRAGFPFQGVSGSSTLFLSFSLNGATDTLAWVFSTPNGIVVTKLGFRYTQRTGTPPAYRISLQAVTNGLPTGTPLGGGTPAEATFTPPADASWDATWQWITLDNSYTTTGAVVAIVIEYSSGTVDGSNFSSITNRTNGAGTSHWLPYVIETNAGTPARTNALLSVYGMQSASLTYGNPLLTITSATFALDSTPDEYALRFMVPTSFCATYSVMGVNALLGAAATGKTMLVTLYDTDGTTPLQTVTWDSDDARTQSDTSVIGTELYFDEATLATLTAGSVYRIGFAPQQNSAGTDQRVLIFDYASNDALSAAQYFGSDWYLNSRTGGGAWTDDATVDARRPAVELIFGDWTPAAAGGGGGSWGSA